MKIGLLTDSNSDVEYDFARKHNLKVVPLRVSFNGEEYFEDEQFDLESYYQNFEEQDLFEVKTSQPSPSGFTDGFEELVEEGHDKILACVASSGLSGTYNSALLAARGVMEEHEGVEIEVVDSRSSSQGTLYLIEKAMELMEKKEITDFAEFADRIREHRKDINTILSLPTLKYLRASGRVSFPKFLLGRIFGLKPIVKVNEEGKNDAVGTTFNLEKGNYKLLEKTLAEDKGTPNCFSIIHANAPDRADRMEEIIREEYDPDVEIRKKITRSSISAHTGPGAIALITRFE